MKHIFNILCITLLTAWPVDIHAQGGSLDDIVKGIVDNNQSLKAMRSSLEAEKYQTRVDNKALGDLDLGFDYLWGDPASIGNRKDFSVTQSVDLAIIFGVRRRFVNSVDELVELKYLEARKSLEMEVRDICISLVYCNLRSGVLAERLEAAESLCELTRTRLESGDISRLEANKSQLNLASVKGAVRSNEIERQSLLAQLKSLNAGQDISLDIREYSSHSMLPESYDAWSAGLSETNPVTARLRKEVEVAENEMRKEKMASLPSLSAGYMSELVVDNNFRGLSVGLSIPLWSSRNRTRQAKASYDAARLQEQDAMVKYNSTLRNLYDRTLELQSSCADYRQTLTEYTNNDLLSKSLASGEITILDYMLERGLYYDLEDQAMQSERDYELSYGKLMLLK